MSDVFISYSSQDRAWAQLLNTALTSQPNNLDVFYDQSRLQKGDKWEPQLRDEIQKARHMVILWSDAAKQSDWVQNERAAFLQNAENDRGRRLIAVNLQGTSAVMSAYQAFDELPQAGVYAPGAAVPGDPAFQKLWNGVTTGIVSAVRDAASAYPIWLMFFTLTRTELASIDPNTTMPWGSSLEEYLRDVGVQPSASGSRRETLLARYHPTDRGLWEPFNRPGIPVRQIVDNALNTVHGDPSVQQRHLAFRWEMVGDEFWGLNVATPQQLMQVRRSYAQRMHENRALIVIDPVAFYTPSGLFLFNEIARCIGSEKAVVLVLPPFYTDPARLRVNQDLQAAVQGFSTYFQPSIPATDQAAFGLAITDESDVDRLLRLAVGRHVRTLEPAAPPHAYLRAATGS